MICTKCGAQIPDDAELCPSCGEACGAALTGPSRELSEDRPAGKRLKLALGLVALAVLVCGSIWFLGHRGRGNKLQKPAERCVSLLQDYIEDLPNLNQLVKNANAIDVRNGASCDVTIENAPGAEIGNGEISVPSNISIGFAWDAKTGKAMSKTDIGPYLGTEFSFPATIYADEQEICVSSPLLEEGEVLTLPAQNLAEAFNASALAKYKNISFPENNQMTSLQELQKGLIGALEARYGKDWSRFKQTVKLEESDESSPFGSEGITYILKWDQQLLEDMLEKDGVDLNTLSAEQMEQTMRELSSVENAEDLGKSQLLLLGLAGKYLHSPMFYVQDEVLKGVGIEIPELSVRVLLQLRGEANPWERITISLYQMEDGKATKLGALDLKLKKESGCLRLNAAVKTSGLKLASVDLIYKDTDGTITAEVNGEAVEDFPELVLAPIDGGLRFDLRVKAEDSEEAEAIDMHCSYSGEVAPIETPKATRKIEVLKLNEEEVKALESRLRAKSMGK